MEIPFLDPLIGLRFEVKIDGDNIGSFTSCEGLGASIDMQEYHEGGENGFSYKIPGRLTFTPIVLTRVDGAGVAQETLELVHHGFLPSNNLLPIGG
jgi:hypothetical protein